MRALSPQAICCVELVLLLCEFDCGPFWKSFDFLLDFSGTRFEEAGPHTHFGSLTVCLPFALLAAGTINGQLGSTWLML